MVDAHPLLEQMKDKPPDGKQMSFEQMLASEETETLPDDVNGYEVAHSVAAPVTGRHQDIRLYVTVLVKTFVEAVDAGLVRDAPFEVRFEDGLIYQPDIVFIGHNGFERVHDTFVEGAPDIIFEVLSLPSTATDRGEKFTVYEAHGVSEYWLIDSVREMVDLYYLSPDGYYSSIRTDIAGRLRSRHLKGFLLDIDLLWKRVLPTTTNIVKMVDEMVSHH